MSQIELEDQEVSADSGAEVGKLVPVTEAIRYRKRAQNSEKILEDVNEQLRVSREKQQHLSEQVEKLKLEQELTKGLVSAGTVDLEAAVLIAKEKMNSNSDISAEEVIKQLGQEKEYLFNTQENQRSARKTSGVKGRDHGVERVLHKFAERAAATGSRKDIHEYQKVKRQVF